MRLTRFRRSPIVLSIMCGLALAAPGVDAAYAQTAPATRVWTVEFHGGGAFGGSGRGTPAAEFPPGTPFTTEGGTPSRIAMSWYFGDGAALFNEVREQFVALGGSVASIEPLDAALRTAVVRTDAGAGFGVRIGRRLSPRYTAEFSFNRSSAGLSVGRAVKDAVEASRASFEAAFTSLFATAPITNLQVTSTASVVEHGGHQTSLTGALLIRIGAPRRLGRYAAVGMGAVVNGGELPTIELRGNYQFRLFGVSPISESDRLTIRFTSGRRVLVAVLGGGITYDVGARQGVRVDARLLLGGRSANTIVEASPSALVLPPGTVLPSATTPAIQFSTTDGILSTLSRATHELTTFTGRAPGLRAHVTVGYFFRF